ALYLARGSPDRALPLALGATIAHPSSRACWEQLARAASELADPLAPRRGPGDWMEPSDRERAFEHAEALLATDQGRAVFERRALDRGAKDPEGSLRVARALLRVERGHEARAQAARLMAAAGPKVPEAERIAPDARFALARGEAALLAEGLRPALEALEEG